MMSPTTYDRSPTNASGVEDTKGSSEVDDGRRL